MEYGSLSSRMREGAAALRECFPALNAETILLQVGTGFDEAGLLEDVRGPVSLGELFPGPSVASPAGHSLDAQFGRCGSQTVLLVRGRRHLYENLGMDECVLPVCAASAAGVRRIIQVSAVGSVRSELKPGAVVAVTDMINNLGASPLAGNQALLSTPFPDMTHTFSQHLTGEFVNAAAHVGLYPRLGVYQANLGPQFETPAETEIACRNGADVVGMSLVPEAIVGHALGARVLGIAIVANQAARAGGRECSHSNVVETVRDASCEVVRALHHLFRDAELPMGEFR